MEILRQSKACLANADFFKVKDGRRKIRQRRKKRSSQVLIAGGDETAI